MLTSSDMLFKIKSSNLVSDLFGLMPRILCLVFVGPSYKFTAPLVKHSVITKGALYVSSYLYAVWLSITNLFLTL